jgi:hypothetical protein
MMKGIEDKGLGWLAIGPNSQRIGGPRSCALLCLLETVQDGAG